MTRDTPRADNSLAAELARALLDRAQRPTEDTSRSERGGAASGPPREGAQRPGPPPPFDELATRRHIETLSALLQAFTLRGRALARESVAQIEAARQARDDAPRSEEADAELLLRETAVRAHAFLVEHPLAARALVSALAAEGRRFAATEDGAALRARLLGSRLIRRGSLLWNSLTMGLIDGTEPSALPSAYIDRLVELGQHPDLERILNAMSSEEGL